MFSRAFRSCLLSNEYFGLPQYVQVETTTKCNLKCPNCMRSIDSNFPISDMTLDTFDSIIDELRYPTKFINLVGLGEPLLNPQIFRMIAHAKRRGFKVSLIDNFTLINQHTSSCLISSGLDYVFASFDSVSKKTFETLRAGANFDEVVKNMRLFADIKKKTNAKTPVFIIKPTVSKDTFPEIPKLIKFAEDIGADRIELSYLFVQDKTYANDLALRINRKDLPKSKIGIDLCELGTDYECLAQTGCYVVFDGTVLPCGHLMEILNREHYSKVQFGNVNCESLDKIWRSSKYREFRRYLESGRRLSTCKNCPGNKNPKESNLLNIF